MTGRTFITITNAQPGNPLAVYREGHRFEIAPGHRAALSVPQGFGVVVTEVDGSGRSFLRETRCRLRIWQAVAFMALAALILSLCACTGPSARRDARAWSNYAQGAGQIINQQEHAK